MKNILHSILLLSTTLTLVCNAEPKPNVLLIISDDQGYGDFGFNGNKLVKTPNLDRLASESALVDKAIGVDRSEAFRIDIAGSGAPKDVASLADRRYDKHHLTLRGERFKYHALPGGKGVLFDIVADPGETADVSAKYPEVAVRMAQACRARWEDLIASGRAFAPSPEVGQKAKRDPGLEN